MCPLVPTRHPLFNTPGELGEYDFTTSFATFDIVRGDNCRWISWRRLSYENELQFPSSSPCDIQALIDAIQKVVSSGTEEEKHPALPPLPAIQHLQGVDAAVYTVLSPAYDASLVPAILRENSDHASCGE